MQALHDAIQSKYGVSSEVSNQVVAALAEIERHRQASGGQAQGFRARTPSDGAPTGGSASIPDINTIIRNTTGSAPSGNRNVSVQGSGLIGIIISVVMSLISMFLGSRGAGQSQNSSAVTNILGDLLGGATHPSQAPDLTNILGGLLGGAGTGGQSANIQDMMQSMLGGQSAPQSGQSPLTRPRSR